MSVASHKSEVLTFHFKHKQKMNKQYAYYENSQNLLDQKFTHQR